MEAIGVVISLLVKWYKAGATNKHRFVGFAASLVVSCFWIYYFINNNQNWLAGHSFVGMSIAVRGLINNRKTEVCK